MDLPSAVVSIMEHQLSGQTSTLSNWTKIYGLIGQKSMLFVQVDKNQLLIGQKSTFIILSFSILTRPNLTQPNLTQPNLT